jgi:hypothetical protein
LIGIRKFWLSFHLDELEDKLANGLFTDLMEAETGRPNHATMEQERPFPIIIMTKIISS